VMLLSVWLAEESQARFEELVPTECGARRVPTSMLVCAAALLVRAAPFALFTHPRSFVWRSVVCK
jgi:hypothetical protein